MKLKNILPGLMLLGLLIVPVVINAADPVIGDKADIEKFITKAVSWLSAILFAAAGLFIIIGAFYYLTAGGEAEKAKKGKGFILGAVIAIVIAILATSFKAIIESFFSNAA
ncbi:MAG: hypothetical protein Q8L36_01050 [bacterium]|nr:hypothetical protein [bacterium]